MHEQPVVSFVVTYHTIREFDERLKRIETAVTKDADNEGELAALRTENATLKARVAELEQGTEAARSRLKESTDKLAGAVAANTPPATGQ